MRRYAQHVETPYLPDPPTDGGAVEGCAGGSCGVLARFFLAVDAAGIVRECTYRMRGREAAMATASALAEAAVSRHVLDAAALGLSTLHPDFGQLDDEQRERALVVEDAFHHALGNCVLEWMRAGHAAPPPRALRSLVAMSGGVDSAVALHAEHERTAGAVAGVTLRLWIDPRAPDPDAACCAPESVRRARATCHALGVAHIGLDLRGAFARQVVAPFVGAYAAGETPNPCVRCNGSFRLDELVACADALGAQHVATGHYVRTVTRAGTVLLQRGLDESKDQSYMLCTLAPSTLARFRFPLGAQTKQHTRARAAELGLAQATAAESQEICFLGGGDYRAFLERADALGPPGEVRTTDGELVGVHDGIARFTPGQRRGLGQLRRTPDAAGGPLYVVDTDPDSGTVVVGERAALRTGAVQLRDAVAHVPGMQRARVKLRYRSREGGSSATVEWGSGGTATLHFDEPVSAPAPGQTACLYDDAGIVVGAGTIVRAQTT